MKLFGKDGMIIPRIFRSFRRETKEEKTKRLRREKFKLFDKYQQESKETATKFGKEYENDELKEILNCESKDYDGMLVLAKKFKRTWWAIKTIVEDRDYYFKNKIMKKTLWTHPKKEPDKLDRFGSQLKKLLDINLL